MWRGMLRTVAATGAFGLVHSALASRAAKGAAERWLGRPASDGPYRVFYVAQSVVTSATLLAYLRRQPDTPLYEAHGLPRLLLRSGQVAGLAYMAWGIRAVGLGRLAGLEGCRRARGVAHDEAPAIESQGPAPGPDGTMHVAGPFRHTRHPLNLAPLPVLWLNPRMTTNLLAFNLAATAYFVLGSIHEEARLRAAYGRAYEDYLRSGVPFYLPGPITPTSIPAKA